MFTVLQVGSTIRSMNASGTMSAPLTLPTGVTIDSTLTPRFARMNRFVYMVNSPSEPLVISSSGEVLPLRLNPPTSALTLASGGAGGLNGGYLGLYTFRLYDAFWNVISESGPSPDMTDPFVAANQKLLATFTTSSQVVNARVLYRTTADGAVYFPWRVVPDNTTLTYTGNESDDSLGIIEMPELGSAPADIHLICAWGGRLWAVTKSARDQVRYSESGLPYAWPELNEFFAGRVGNDEAGVSAFIPRRNALGLAKKTEFTAVAGTSRDNFVQVTLSEQIGCESQESVAIYRDTAYFLWRDGVYAWSDEGFKCVSDEGNVRTWFDTDTVFNRGVFYKSFASIDPTTLRYRLFLASAGQSTINRWVEYDLRTGAWFGPHSTSAFTPTCALEVFGADNLFVDMVGSSAGAVSVDTDTRADWATTPISMRVGTKHFTKDFEATNYFGELSIFTERATSGTLLVTPEVGDTTSAAKAAWSHSLTRERRRLGRIGYGRTAQLVLRNAELNVNPVIYGFRIDPVFPVGRR